MPLDSRRVLCSKAKGLFVMVFLHCFTLSGASASFQEQSHEQSRPQDPIAHWVFEQPSEEKKEWWKRVEVMAPVVLVATLGIMGVAWHKRLLSRKQEERETHAQTSANAVPNGNNNKNMPVNNERPSTATTTPLTTLNNSLPNVENNRRDFIQLKNDFITERAAVRTSFFFIEEDLNEAVYTGVEGLHDYTPENKNALDAALQQLNGLKGAAEKAQEAYDALVSRGKGIEGFKVDERITGPARTKKNLATFTLFIKEVEASLGVAESEAKKFTTSKEALQKTLEEAHKIITELDKDSVNRLVNDTPDKSTYDTLQNELAALTKRVGDAVNAELVATAQQAAHEFITKLKATQTESITVSEQREKLEGEIEQLEKEALIVNEEFQTLKGKLKNDRMNTVQLQTYNEELGKLKEGALEQAKKDYINAQKNAKSLLGITLDEISPQDAGKQEAYDKAITKAITAFKTSQTDGLAGLRKLGASFSEKDDFRDILISPEEKALRIALNELIDEAVAGYVLTHKDVRMLKALKRDGTLFSQGIERLKGFFNPAKKRAPTSADEFLRYQGVGNQIQALEKDPFKNCPSWGGLTTAYSPEFINLVKMMVSKDKKTANLVDAVDLRVMKAIYDRFPKYTSYTTEQGEFVKKYKERLKQLQQ